MRSKLRLTLAAALALAATPALSDDRGSPSGHDGRGSLSGHDDVDYGAAPAAAAWGATVQARNQDDSRMQPPTPAPGTERTSGVKADVQYDDTRMVPEGR
jgi:hypothetical protein